jgi:two-component system sensor histidine kinase and response regulator WspE
MDNKKKRILIIEDDSVLRKMYSQKLLTDGYEVVGAADGVDAMDIFKREDFDLVITDIMLPGMSGNEILEKIMSTKKGKKIPLIAWSNLPKDDDKNKAIELGAKEYLEKGKLTLEDVSETVKKYLG